MCRCLGVQDMSLGIVGRVAKERAGLVAQEILLW
jgi:hypothetical protein